MIPACHKWLRDMAFEQENIRWVVLAPAVLERHFVPVS